MTMFHTLVSKEYGVGSKLLTEEEMSSCI